VGIRLVTRWLRCGTRVGELPINVTDGIFNQRVAETGRESSLAGTFLVNTVFSPDEAWEVCGLTFVECSSSSAKLPGPGEDGPFLAIKVDC